MPFDLALSENCDLLVTGSRDLAGTVGDALIEQRIKTRLKIKQGSWSLDDTGDLGSLIHSYLGYPIGRFVERLPDTIRSALADMDDIQINEIRITDVDTLQDTDLDVSEVLAVISYSHIAQVDFVSGEPTDLASQTVVVSIGTGD